MWDTATGRQLLVLRGHRAAVSSVAFAARQGRDREPGRDGQGLGRHDAGQPRLAVRSHAHPGGVESVDYSPNSKQLLTTG